MRNHKGLHYPVCQSWEVTEGATLSDWHDDECAMCGAKADRLAALVVDHDHMTGLIRGHLCRGCNISEARQNTPEWVAWRGGLNPATILGIQEQYQHMFPGQDYFERMKRLPFDDAALDEIAHAAVYGLLPGETA